MNVTAERVAAARERRGLDQSALARAIGVTQGAISKIEQGRTANSRLLPRIASRTGVSLRWLLGETDDPDSDLPDDALTGDEREALDLLRALDPKQRAALLQLARTLTSDGEQPTAQPTLHDQQTAYRVEERK